MREKEGYFSQLRDCHSRSLVLTSHSTGGGRFFSSSNTQNSNQLPLHSHSFSHSITRPKSVSHSQHPDSRKEKMYSARREGEEYAEMEERSLETFNGDHPINKSGPNDVDRVLYNDLVEIVPLVQSLIVIFSLSLYPHIFFLPQFLFGI